MKKHIKRMKRLIAILSILAMSTNSFAAVGGNDGSAFVTKAEFDALVNTFNEQMDNYAASLETKVDGAIANYLMSLDSTQTIELENYIESAKNANIKNVQFMKWVAPQATKDVEDVAGGFAYAFAYGCGIGKNNTGSGCYNYYNMNSSSAWSGGFNWTEYTNFTGNKANYTSSYYYAEFPFSNKTDWTLQTINRKRLYMRLYACSINFRFDQLAKTNTSVRKRTDTNMTMDVTSWTQPTSGVKNITATIYDAVNPSMRVAQTHSWSNTSADDVTNNQCLEYNISGAISGSNKSVDYEFRDYYDNTKPITVQIQSKKEASSVTSYNGADPGANIALLYQGIIIRDENSGQSGRNDVKFYWKYNKPTIYTLNWSDLTSSYWNAILGNALYKYQGIPITKVNKEGLVKIHMTLNNADPGAYVYAIADARFPNRTIPETMIEEGYDHILVRGTVSRSGDEVLDLQIDKQTIFDKDNGDYLYIKIDPAVAGQKVTVTVDSVTQLIES